MNKFKITTAALSLALTLMGCNSNNSQSSSPPLPSEYNIDIYTPMENSTGYTGTWVLVTPGNTSTREFVQIREENNRLYLTQCMRHEIQINIENHQLSFSSYNLTGQNYNYFYGDKTESNGYLTMVKINEDLDPLGTLTIDEGNANRTFDINAVCYDLTNSVNGDQNGSSISRIFQVKLPDLDQIGDLSRVELISGALANNSSTVRIARADGSTTDGIGVTSYSENINYDFPVDSDFEIFGSISTTDHQIEITVKLQQQ